MKIHGKAPGMWNEGNPEFYGPGCGKKAIGEPMELDWTKVTCEDCLTLNPHIKLLLDHSKMLSDHSDNAMNALNKGVTQVRYLLENFVECPEGTFTFPDGDTYHVPPRTCTRGVHLRDPGKALQNVTAMLGAVDGFRTTPEHQHLFHLVSQTAADLIRAAAYLKGPWTSRRDFNANQAAIKIALSSARDIGRLFRELARTYKGPIGTLVKPEQPQGPQKFVAWFQDHTTRQEDEWIGIIAKHKSEAWRIAGERMNGVRFALGSLYTFQEFVNIKGEAWGALIDFP